MIGAPMLDPRDIAISELETRKKQFFAAGNSIKKIPIGKSGIDPGATISTHQKMQRTERAKIAPALRKYADEGACIKSASRGLKIKLDRATLIAKENGIVFNAK